MTEAKRGLVLAGGGARGAYEAGVLAYIFNELPRELLKKNPIKVFAGTSVGAIHATYLAATAEAVDHDVGRLINLWRTLRIEKMLRLGPRHALSIPREVRALFTPNDHAQGILINSNLLREVVIRNCPWGNISKNLRSGAVDALTVSTTHIASGKTTVFVDTERKTLPAWSRDPRVEVKRARIGPSHALASAAIPVLFPPVKLDGSYYSDGGLRQNTPLSPVLRLGCDRVLVIGLRHDDDIPAPSPQARLDAADSEPYPSPVFLLGKVVDALMLDRLEYDLLRLEGFNQILRDGEAAFGDEFIKHLGESTQRIRGASYRQINTLVIRPSRDLGEMAHEFIDVLRSQLGRISGWLLKALASGEVLGESDLLSYLLFDGRLGAALIELGRADADASRQQLIEFFSD